MANTSIGEMNVGINFDTSSFEQGLKNLQKGMSVLDSEMRVTQSSVEAFGNTTDGLKAKEDALSQKIELQKQKVQALQQAYNNSVETKGKDATATQNLEIRLNNANTALNKMQGQLKDTQTQLKNIPNAFDKMSKALDTAKEKINTIGSGLTSLGTKLTLGVTTPIVALAKTSLDAVNGEIANTTKLTTIMKQRMNATTAQISAVKKLTDVQRQLGVVDDDAQMAGAQQLATFLHQSDSINTLIPAMNNLVAQQHGYNATEEDATSVANMMGKVLDGNVGALSRVGISFTDVQKKMLQTGNEQQKVATLAQVITDNVGQMNSALGQTDEGKIVRAKEALTDLQKELGGKLLPVLGDAAGKVADLANKLPDLSDKTKNLLVQGLGVAAVTGPAIAILGKLTPIIAPLGSNIVSLGGKLEDLSNKGLNLGKTFGTNVQNGFSKMIDAIKKFSSQDNAISKTFSKMLSGVGNFNTNLANKIKGIASIKIKIPFLDGIAEKLKGLAPVVSNAFGTLGGVAQNAAGKLQSIAGLALKFVGPAALIGLLLAGLGALQGKFGEQINQFAQIAISKGPIIIQNLINGIVSKLPALINSGVTLINTFLNVIVANLPTILNGGVQILTALINGVVNNINNIIPAIITVITTILTALVNNLPAILDAGLKILMALVDGIVNNIDKIIDGIIQVMMAIINKIPEFLPQLIEAGIKIIVALIEGLAKALPQLIAYLPQIIEAIFNAFKSIDWGEIGRNIIQGLVDGLKAVEHLIWDTLSGLANDALQGFKKLFGIHSPSTIFFGFGDYMMQGLANGISENADRFSNSLNKMKGLADNTFNKDYSYNINGISTNLSGLTRKSIENGNPNIYNTNNKTNVARNNIVVQFYPQTMTENELDKAFKYIDKKYSLSF